MLTGHPDRRLDLGFPGTTEKLSISLAEQQVKNWWITLILRPRLLRGYILPPRKRG